MTIAFLSAEDTAAQRRDIPLKRTIRSSEKLRVLVVGLPPDCEFSWGVNFYNDDTGNDPLPGIGIVEQSSTLGQREFTFQMADRPPFSNTMVHIWVSGKNDRFEPFIAGYELRLEK